jgi:hypothetical protein
VKHPTIPPLPEDKASEMVNDASEQQICPPTLAGVEEAAAFVSVQLLAACLAMFFFKWLLGK